MVWKIKELRSELNLIPFIAADIEILEDRDIHKRQARADYRVTPQVPEKTGFLHLEGGGRVEITAVYITLHPVVEDRIFVRARFQVWATATREFMGQTSVA